MMFRLALALGQPHPDRLAAELTSAEFSEWIAFYSIEPFGSQADDLRAGVVAAVTANTVRSKGQKAARPADFFHSLREAPAVQEVERLSVDDTMNSLARSLGVKRRSDSNGDDR